MSALTDMWDEQRRRGRDAHDAVAELVASTGIDRDTLIRQLDRSLTTDDRDPGRELHSPLSRRWKADRMQRRHTTIRVVPTRPTRQDEAA